MMTSVENFVSDTVLRQQLRASLPVTYFQRPAWRAWRQAPYSVVWILIHSVMVKYEIEIWLAIPLSVLLGAIQASMMFFAHEVAHGAVLPRGPIRGLLQYLGCASFLLSPHLWDVWHNRVHHGRTGTEGDPDHFGTVASFFATHHRSRLIARLWPGMGALGLAYPFYFFTVQGLDVLFRRSRSMPGFEALRKKRAVLDTIGMALIWGAYALLLGPRKALFLVLIPMAIANCVILLYVMTNHMLLPLAGEGKTLRTTLSIKTHPLVDGLTFHFSHHVEHHLFPSMPSCYYPHVRKALQSLYPKQFLLMSHLHAIRLIFSTPRYYDGDDLVDPLSWRRIALSGLVTTDAGWTNEETPKT